MDSISEEADSDKFEQAKNYFLLGMENFEKGMYREAENLLFLDLVSSYYWQIHLDSVKIKRNSLSDSIY